MKSVIAAACAALLLIAPNLALAADAAILAPIRQMNDAFAKGDVASAKAAHVAAPTIIDNVPPFLWSGPKAFDAWLGDLQASEAALGKSGGVVTWGEAVEEVVDGDRAYVVTRSTYEYKLKGVQTRESGMTAFTLVKEAGGWKIQSWSWASPHGVTVRKPLPFGG